MFTLAVYEVVDGVVFGAQLTHENVTAAVAAVRALFPPLRSRRWILSCRQHPLSTAFGRAVAYTAIYEGTSFATVLTSELYHAEDG